MRIGDIFKVLRSFFSPEAIVPFVLASLALGVVGNACYDLLKKAFGESWNSILLIGVAAILVLVLAAAFIAYLVQRPRTDFTRSPGFLGSLFVISRLSGPRPPCER